MAKLIRYNLRMSRPEKPLDYYFKSDGVLHKIMRHAEYLQWLDKSLKAFIPVELRPYVKVVNMREDILVVQTPNSAIATKLRFILPGILARLQQDLLPGLQKIEVKIL